MSGWIKFKGISSEFFGLKIEDMPARITGKRRVESVPIPGRSGVLHVDEESYDSIELSVGINMNGSTSINDAIAWLDGYGELIFSDSPDFAYKAFVTTGPQVKRRRLANKACYDSFTVKFECDPFLYEATPDAPEKLIMPGILTNIGTVFSEPLIEVRGTGDITAVIGDIAVTLLRVTGSVFIDCDAKIAYLTDPTEDPVTIVLEDESWPVLGLGETTVNWLGEVTKLIISPRWSWL